MTRHKKSEGPSEEEFRDFAEREGFVAIDLEAEFEKGHDWNPLKHWLCGGDIDKLAPGMMLCERARCELCGKIGPVKVATFYYRDLIEEIEDEEGNWEYGRMFAIFEGEPKPKKKDLHKLVTKATLH
jgi:hypothetical protein